MGDLAATAARLLARRMRWGTLFVDGVGGGFAAGCGDPKVVVTVHDHRAYGAVLRHGSVGLAQSYAQGWWDADDLSNLVRLVLRNLAGPMDLADRVGQALDGPLSWWRRRAGPSKETDRHNVMAHYDLPEALFEAMLDETMTYSCALWDQPQRGLGPAQVAKLDRVCAKVDLGPKDHVVEIGSGWGGFALHAARTYDCRVTTTTVSPSQQRYVNRLVHEAGLDGQIQVLGTDYRDLEGTYDKVVSIEMIEAVDWRHHDEFFATCRRLLRPQGQMLLQAIVIADASYARARHHRDFIRQTVFPGGCIPSISALCASLTRASDLRLYDLEDIGRHYPATLQAWCDNIDRAWGRVAGAGLDEAFRRLWRLYLCYCEAAFIERHISDVQMVMVGPQFRPPSPPGAPPAP